MTPEFDLIARYFTRVAERARLGVGDDCALIAVPAGMELAISTDTLVSGTHFFADADAVGLGHKALAVNLSDLAAMGSAARYVTLALTLPAVDDTWLAGFARGFFALADAHGVELIGGDTTRGPLSMTLTVMGEVPVGGALRRDGARDGDDIWVSGSLGGAALMLRHMQGKMKLPDGALAGAAELLHKPQPRLALGLALRGRATAAIDISDGLVADLGHIGERSKLRADIMLASIPLYAIAGQVDERQRLQCALSGGDDYELCFTAPPQQREAIAKMAAELSMPLTRIGVMRAGDPEVRVLDEAGRQLVIGASGFDHFAVK